MILKKIPVNTALGEPTNCYIIQDEETKETMLMGIIICLSLLIDTLDYMTNPRRH